MNAKGLIAALLCLVGGVAAAEGNWWNAEWHYRMPVTVDSGMFERTDYLVRVPLDLKKLAADAEIGTGVDVASLRVVELDADTGKTKEIPSIFRKNSDFFRGVKEEGSLTWQMAGKTPTLTQRFYYLYLDAKGSGKTAPSYAAIPGADEVVGENLIPNSSFEEVDAKNQPVGWSAIGITAKTVGSGEVTDKEAHTGKRSLYISKPALAGDGYKYIYGGWVPSIKAKPGRKYELSGWIKATGTGQQCMQMGFVNDKGQYTKEHIYVMPAGSGAHDWKRASAVATAPPESCKMFVQVHLYKAQGEVYYDDVEIREIPSEQPPTITAAAIEKSKP